MQRSSPTLRITLLDIKDVCGVTLIELLVGILIIGMIVTSVYTAFNCSRDSWQVGEIMVQRYQNARAALDMMSREISAMYFAVSNIYETGLIYNNDGFRFVARIPDNSGQWDLCIIGYRYDSTDREIERAIDVYPDMSPLNVKSYIDGLSLQPLVSNIRSETEKALKFYCIDESGNIYLTWDSASSYTLPSAVEIRIRAQDEKQLADEQAFRTIAYIPQSKQNE